MTADKGTAKGTPNGTAKGTPSDEKSTNEPDNSDGSRRFSSGDLAPAAAVGFVFLILRIFAVSGYDWNTAFAVSTTPSLSDGLALVFGSLMAGHVLVEILLVVVLPLLLATYLWSSGGHRATVLLATTLGSVTLIALTVSFKIWWLPAATAAVFVAFVLIRKVSVKHLVRRLFARAMASVGWVAAAAVLLVAAFVQTPWVPHEQIKTTNGAVSGYVLSVDSGYLNVLTDEHEFVILNSSDVLSRK
ncbi:hypothetical protein [Arthrobacter sp. H35-D1]|uniref:hypothetical protein n=1 Tax=Arthrobacter sp. H35-D1 TaxID=3046202 RepID=UPI0024B9CB1C|nr:hypothetical protein [Arthrobacter sp. H35-D1]MDJ0312569.1 hypothetical protein [Arthrobacter sp. H35-D1]